MMTTFTSLPLLLPSLTLLTLYTQTTHTHYLLLAIAAVHPQANTHPIQQITCELHKRIVKWIDEKAMTWNERNIVAWAPAILFADFIAILLDQCGVLESIFPVYTLSTLLPSAALTAAFALPAYLPIAERVILPVVEQLNIFSSLHKTYARYTTVYALILVYAAIWTFGIVPHIPLQTRGYKWFLNIIHPSTPRVLLLVYWAITAIITVAFFLFVIPPLRPDRVGPRKRELNWRRKVFHILGTCMILPAANIDPELLFLVLPVGTAILLVAEYLRVIHCLPFHRQVTEFLEGFVDSKDSGHFILSHIYLIAGVGFGWMLSSDTARWPATATSGIISLGIGDSMASLVGQSIGTHIWPGGYKSVEGTVAYVLSVTIAGELLVGNGWLTWLSIGVGGGLLEALCKDNDNIIVPMWAFIVCGLCGW